MRVNSYEIDIVDVIHFLKRQVDGFTHDARVDYLILLLSHPTARVRDEAALGLADLEDKRGYLPIITAAMYETNLTLKEDLLNSARNLDPERYICQFGE